MIAYNNSNNNNTNNNNNNNSSSNKYGAYNCLAEIELVGIAVSSTGSCLLNSYDP